MTSLLHQCEALRVTQFRAALFTFPTRDQQKRMQDKIRIAIRGHSYPGDLSTIIDKDPIAPISSITPEN